MKVHAKKKVLIYCRLLLSLCDWSSFLFMYLVDLVGALTLVVGAFFYIIGKM